MRLIRFILLLCAAFVIVLPNIAQDAPLQVIASTTIITDIAQNVGGDFAEVTALVPPESDSHAFQPRPSDLRMLADADVVLMNGMGLEGFLDDVVAAANVTPRVVTDGIVPLVEDEHGDEDEGEHEADSSAIVCEGDGDQADADHDEHGACDPHVWGNPQNVIMMVENIVAIFSDLDPDNAEHYRANADAYIAELEALDSEIESLFTDIPEDERVMVTNHDFMGYFADRYHFTVIGTVIPGVSTLSEPTPRELAALSQAIRELGVPAIFVEISATEGLSQAVVNEVSDVEIVALYSDYLSAADGDAPTYIEMMRFNAQAIAGVFGD